MPRPTSASYKSRDRGSLEFESKLHKKEGQIMKIVREDPITISPSFLIKDASEKMVDKDVRRLPVTSPGTKKLHGMLVSRNIINFLGGGEKHEIIEEKHEGNFLSAINDRVKIIMDEDCPSARKSFTIAKVAKLLRDEEVGGVPVLNDEDEVVGIVTEREFASYIPNPAKTTVGEHMTGKVVTAEPELFLVDAMKRMISEGFRRLPVVEKGRLQGLLTSVDILEYFATNEMFNHMASGDASDALSIEISEIMTKNPITTEPKEDLGKVSRRMESEGHSGLPVLDNGELVGIITERDILEILI